MKLLFKQRFFSWFDSYDIYDGLGNTVFTVEGKLSWGHCLHILDAHGRHIGTVKERLFTFLPKFELYVNDQYVGEICKEFTFFKPQFTLNCNGWQVDGDFFEWDYEVRDAAGEQIAIVSKELFRWTDTYQMHIYNPEHALYVLMIVLAIDAVKCSQN